MVPASGMTAIDFVSDDMAVVAVAVAVDDCNHGVLHNRVSLGFLLLVCHHRNIYHHYCGYYYHALGFALCCYLCLYYTLLVVRHMLYHCVAIYQVYALQHVYQVAY